MSHTIDTSVLIVGAGPVGLTLALDLAWRGVNVTIVERRSAGEAQTARSFAMDAGVSNARQRREIPADVELSGPEGEAVRARIGKEAYDLYVRQQCCGGLNFGYFYAGSPIIAYDGEAQPAYTMDGFTPSSVPGCRAPHLWLDDGGSLYDRLGRDYTLIRTDPTLEVVGLVEAAQQRGVPLLVLDIDARDARQLYPCGLTLVRPDQHVAWRGNEEPSRALELIDRVRGAG